MVSPEFSRRAAAVVNSPFWSTEGEPPDSATPAEYVAWRQRLHDRKERLADAVNSAERYDDLGKEAKAEFHAVEEFNRKHAGTE